MLCFDKRSSTLLTSIFCDMIPASTRAGLEITLVGQMLIVKIGVEEHETAYAGCWRLRVNWGGGCDKTVTCTSTSWT